MFIRGITIRKFRHLENLTFGPFEMSSKASDAVVLAGPNGGGKSSVLELLGYALSNSWSLGWNLARSFPTSSFEVAIGLTPDEIDLLPRPTSDGKPTDDDPYQYLLKNRTYYRSFNYQEGEYNKNPTLHNLIHNLVTITLRNKLRRALGFFLRSDRHYPRKGFRRDRLFEYQQMSSTDHIWSLAFNTSDVQYEDMFDYLVQQRFHYFRQLGAFHHAKAAAQLPPGAAEPNDPLKPYDDLLNQLFPGYHFSDSQEDVPSNLFIKIPSGAIIQFSDLSSGEQEVFFVLSFFLRHDVSNAIVVLDEPELHLHPEFARLLVRTMQSIKPGNQLWIATHNPEIIDEAGKDKTTYISRKTGSHIAEVTRASDEEESIQKLRDLFGYSGYIGIAKTMVFLEGRDASADRKMFSRACPPNLTSIKFIPAGGNDSLPRVNAAILSILESTLSWCRFYLIRDRDYLTQAAVEKYSTHVSGRLHVLERNQIENYLLDESLISAVLKEYLGKEVTPSAVLDQLRRIAKGMAGEVLRDMIAFRLNFAFGPQDFSLGKMLEGQNILMDNNDWSPEVMSALEARVLAKTKTVTDQLQVQGAEHNSKSLLDECKQIVRASLVEKADGWRSMFPGKRILQIYSRELGLGHPTILHNCLIKELGGNQNLVPDDLKKVFEVIAAGGTFGVGAHA